MFIEEFEKLNNVEKESFKRITNLLLAKTFLVNRIYDKKQNIYTSNADYRFVERNTELFRDYLEFAGYKLIKDTNYEVAYIENEYGYNKKRLDKNTVIFLYGLRLKYDEEREKLNLSTDVVVNVADIVKTLIDVGAYTKKPADTEIRQALSTLVNFNIIQKIDGIIEKPETKILIYPSILFVITNEKISNLSKNLTKMLADNENDLDEDTTENIDENLD